MEKGDIAIGYIRLSDRNQALGGGIKNQEDAIRKYVKDRGLILFNDKVYVDIYTGSVSSSERPVYTSLIKEIQKLKGKIKYFVIKKIDRSSRAGSQEYLKTKIELRILGVELRDVDGVIQPEFNRLDHRGVGYTWSNTSPSYLAEVIIAELAAEERKGILIRTVDTSVDRIEQGYKVRQSNYGFENKQVVGKDGKLKYIQIPYDPEAKYIRELFRLSVETIKSDKEITETLNAQGCKTRSQNLWNKNQDAIIGRREGNSLSEKQMQRWRKNPIYAGVIVENWGQIQKKQIIRKADYDGLVSVDVFNRANKGKVYIQFFDKDKVKVLYNQKPDRDIKRRQKFNSDYKFKNVILCNLCRQPLKASASTGGSGKRVPAYHCDRGHKYLGYPQAIFEENVNKFLDKLRFADKHYAVLEKTLIYRFRKEVQLLNKSHINVSEKEISLRNELSEVEIAIQKSTSDLLRRNFEKKYEETYKELELVKSEKEELTITEDELVDFLKEVKKIVEQPKNILINVTSFEQQIATYSLFFEKFPTYDEIISGTPKLTLFFKMISDEEVQTGQLVTLRGIEPRFDP
jgi:DNA invertase Pin-like site-specific DNA recombinase